MNILLEKTEQLKWQSWTKGLAVGLIAGLLAGAYLQALYIASNL